MARQQRLDSNQIDKQDDSESDEEHDFDSREEDLLSQTDIAQ